MVTNVLKTLKNTKILLHENAVLYPVLGISCLGGGGRGEAGGEVPCPCPGWEVEQGGEGGGKYSLLVLARCWGSDRAGGVPCPGSGQGSRIGGYPVLVLTWGTGCTLSWSWLWYSPFPVD